MEAKGNIVDHEYKIERGGDKVAEVSKRWFRVRDTYGIEIRRIRTTRSSSPSPSASTRWRAADLRSADATRGWTRPRASVRRRAKTVTHPSGVTMAMEPRV